MIGPGLTYTKQERLWSLHRGPAGKFAFEGTWKSGNNSGEVKICDKHQHLGVRLRYVLFFVCVFLNSSQMITFVHTYVNEPYS